MLIKILNYDDLRVVVRSFPLTPAFAILLTGDRLACCDEGVALEVGGQVVGVATIAPHGEEYSGTPTLVALYVNPEHRRHGYARIIAEAAAKRCIERGFDHVRVDVMSAYALRIFTSLPPQLDAIFDIHDLGAIMDSLP